MSAAQNSQAAAAVKPAKDAILASLSELVAGAADLKPAQLATALAQLAVQVDARQTLKVVNDVPSNWRLVCLPKDKRHKLYKQASEQLRVMNSDGADPLEALMLSLAVLTKATREQQLDTQTPYEALTEAVGLTLSAEGELLAQLDPFGTNFKPTGVMVRMTGWKLAEPVEGTNDFEKVVQLMSELDRMGALANARGQIGDATILVQVRNLVASIHSKPVLSEQAKLRHVGYRFRNSQSSAWVWLAGTPTAQQIEHHTKFKNELEYLYVSDAGVPAPQFKPEQLLQIARRTGLRDLFPMVNNKDATDALVVFLEQVRQLEAPQQSLTHLL
ncbi:MULTISPECIES: hypothetical protein [Herbaspirillum]|uniref:Uncharacterized protein n=2 Tax=Herbaspirillum huttiense TaxID=863372 RepID=A0AAJ2LVZ2_9BURK|nr:MULTISPECIES: hypothetical protein [Herbaspirillum]MDR9837003.1 hypothetical protein [Herbaspirillum huttiense]